MSTSTVLVNTIYIIKRKCAHIIRKTSADMDFRVCNVDYQIHFLSHQCARCPIAPFISSIQLFRTASQQCPGKIVNYFYGSSVGMRQQQEA